MNFVASLVQMNGLRYDIGVWKICYFVAFPFVCKCIANGSEDFFSKGKERKYVLARLSK